jgi:beta-glucanase (GH16 family)
MAKRILFLAFILLLAQYSQAQYTLWDLIYCLNGGENKSAGIPGSGDPNPPDKPGWNLIFSDEFENDSIDRAKWSPATPWDDGAGDCRRDFAKNPANIASLTDRARILNTADAPLPGCKYSGGEIKSMSVRDSAFSSYYFYAPGFLEARVRLFSASGQGAAMWLWGIGEPGNPGGQGPWSEIDVFELNGHNRNIFTGTYHWTDSGQHVSQLHAVYLTESSAIYDLTDRWTTFGLEWDSLFIRWYVNNTLIKELDLGKIPPFCIDAGHYAPPTAPYCVRFTTGANPVGNQAALVDPAELPQSMEIDYVRVWSRKDQYASPILVPDLIGQICATATSFETSEKTVLARYFPEAVYQWSSPAFELAPEPYTIPHPPGKMRIWIKPGIAPGHSYPIYLSTTFPGRFTELDSLHLFISDASPAPHLASFFPAQKDSSCYYEIRTEIPPTAGGFEFQPDTTGPWQRGTIQKIDGKRYACFGHLKPQSTVGFRFRLLNGCGASPVVESGMTIPPPVQGCIWPTAAPEPDFHGNAANPFSIHPNPANDVLTVTCCNPGLLNSSQFMVSIINIQAIKEMDCVISNENTQLDIRSLKPGIYFIRIIDNQGRHYPGKFIKN